MLILKKFAFNLLFHKNKLFKNERGKFQFLKKNIIWTIKLKVSVLVNLMDDKYTIIIKNKKILEITDTE